MDQKKMLAVANIVVTCVTLACSVVSGIIGAEQMKGAVSEEVSRQLAETTAKESV